MTLPFEVVFSFFIIIIIGSARSCTHTLTYTHIYIHFHTHHTHTCASRARRCRDLHPARGFDRFAGLSVRAHTLQIGVVFLCVCCVRWLVGWCLCVCMRVFVVLRLRRPALPLVWCVCVFHDDYDDDDDAHITRKTSKFEKREALCACVRVEEGERSRRTVVVSLYARRLRRWYTIHIALTCTHSHTYTRISFWDRSVRFIRVLLAFCFADVVVVVVFAVVVVVSSKPRGEANIFFCFACACFVPL